MELPEQQVLMWKEFARTGGERGIRTLDTGFSPYNGLANRRLQPLGHLSGLSLDYSGIQGPFGRLQIERPRSVTETRPF